MKKLFIITLLSMLAAFNICHANKILIESGDTIHLYMTDINNSDLVAGTMTKALGFNKDPHEIIVSQEGRINVPILGPIYVVGKTPVKVEQEIAKKLYRQIKLKRVAVLLISKKVNDIYVLGEVNQPGLIKIEKNKQFEMKLMNLISKAGGFTDRANKREVIIVKPDNNKITVNLEDIVFNKTSTPNLLISDKDTIIIPQSTERIYVLGEVRAPGGYSFINGAGFADYVAEAGGFNKEGDLESIGIIKQKGDKTHVYKVSMNKSQYITEAQKQLNLEPGDTIYIPRHFWADWKDIGTVLGIARDSIYIYDTTK